MLAEDFVHLHIHSEYSLLDGSIRIKKLVKELAARKATAAALTDHDGMHGVLEFYLECKGHKEGPLNGIIGYEANVEFFSPKLAKKLGHLVLIAENNTGYTNLVKLCSLANTVGKNHLGPDATCLTWNQMREYSEGLICLTGCLKGELAQLVANNHALEAQEYLDHLVSVFGKSSVFVELIDNNLAEQKRVVPLLAEIAAANSFGIVATADVHYLHRKDREMHLNLLAIKHKLQKNDVRGADPFLEFHLATFEEMQEKFKNYPEALENTKTIADRCKVTIDTKSIFMPDYRQRPEESADECIVRLSREGLAERRPAIEVALGARFSEEVWQEYLDRLEYELSVINKMKFAGYFLIVQDFINWAKQQNIPVGPGRGSAAGSLVTYALKITNIDPIRFTLLFERFLNPERISMPDIDTDFCQERRAEVLNYVYERYGARNVSQIVTFGRLMAKNALKNLARILGWSFHDSNDFAKLIPETPGITLEKAYEEEEKIRERLDVDERAKTLWDGALEIEGILNSLGIHAAGVIIADRPLDERCPQLESEGQMLTQFENKYAEKVGLIKFDFLGLKTLTVIDKAVKLVHHRHDPSFDIELINLEDTKVYENISTAHVTGIFQLESNGMRKLIADLKPTCFTDIIAVLALFRPGPLGSGMVEDFVLRKHGKNPVEYSFAELEPILADTYGVIVYQEQVQKIAAVLANYSLGEADLLRRAMGKKDKNEMEKQKARFVEGSTSNGHDALKSSDLFDLMAKFAEYGFNKSHTAAYGWVTFQTAYLKTYYPTEFMTAIMSCDLDNTEKIVTYVRDCKRMKITLLPPNVNASDFEFSIPADRVIQFGMGAIKGLGKGIIDLIVQERKAGGPFQTVSEFIARCDARKINKKVMESLIKSGAFDEIASNRAELLANCDSWVRSISKESDRQDTVGGGIFGSCDDNTVAMLAMPPARLQGAANSDVNAKLHTPAAAGVRLKKGAQAKPRFLPLARPTQTIPAQSPVLNLLVGVQLKKTQPWPYLVQLEQEFATLGFYMTGHPSDLMRQDIDQLGQVPLSDAPLFLDNDDVPDYKRRAVKVAGMVSMTIEKRTKDGAKFCILKIEDGTGELEIAIFAKQYAALTQKFEVGDAIWVECKIKKGIEDGTVKGTCNTIGRIADKRIELAKHIFIETDAGFLDEAANIDKLRELLAKCVGTTPVSLEIALPQEKMKVRAQLGKHSVRPTDEFILSLETAWPGRVLVRRAYGHQMMPS